MEVITSFALCLRIPVSWVAEGNQRADPKRSVERQNCRCRDSPPPGNQRKSSQACIREICHFPASAQLFQGLARNRCLMEKDAPIERCRVGSRDSSGSSKSFKTKRRGMLAHAGLEKPSRFSGRRSSLRRQELDGTTRPIEAPSSARRCRLHRLCRREEIARFPDTQQNPSADRDRRTPNEIRARFWVQNSV
jgi:hypothetical protein